MSKRSILALMFIFTLLFAVQGFAADMESSSGADQSSQSGMSSGSATTGGAAGMSSSAGSISQMSKSDLMGKNVISSDGKSVGKVSDVVSDPATNNIAYAIVSFQGRDYPVPANALSASADKLALNIDKSKFDNAPTLPQGQKPDINDTALNNQVTQFYGVAPSFGAGSSSGATAPSGGAESGSSMPGGASSGGSSSESSGSSSGNSSRY